MRKKLVDAFEWLLDESPYPHRWPTWARRLFLLGFPLTFPVWVLYCCIWWIGLVLFLSISIAALMVIDLWNGDHTR
jgi:hypothetical protein